MSIINHLSREISAKIVFYGPGLSGKTTTLKFIHTSVRVDRRGDFVSLATETDRTIFFDFLPLHIERVQGMAVRLQLYTVPGQVFYAATRKLVLNGADGVVFVADSQSLCWDANQESLDGLRDNLDSLGVDIASFPLVFQYNKRDLPNIVPVEQMSAKLNLWKAPEFYTSATSGEGVLPVLKEITRLVIHSLWRQPTVAHLKTLNQTEIRSDDSTVSQLKKVVGEGEDKVADADEMEIQNQQNRGNGKRPVADDSIIARLASIAAASKAKSTPNIGEDNVSPAATDAERISKTKPDERGKRPHPSSTWHSRTDSPQDPETRSQMRPTSKSPTLPPESPSDMVGMKPNTDPSSLSEPYIIERKISSIPSFQQANNGVLSFAGLWIDEGEQRQIKKIESHICEGLYGEAIRSITEVLARLLESLPGPNNGEGQSAKAALLGLDGLGYFKLCKLAISPDQAISHEDVLFALCMLVTARIKSRSI